MVYITGDIHGNPEYIIYLSQKLGLTKDDILVLLGDVGANYYLGKRDNRIKEAMSKYIEATILCIHGNHEARPASVAGYQLKVWNEGLVYAQEEYPNILFAQDGSIFNLEGNKCLILGGAYSVDKYYRLQCGYAWFEDEQPSDKIKALAESQIANVGNKVDIVFSHTCPFKYIPTEMFLAGLDQSTVDNSTELWLDEIEAKLDYKAWYCGHYHTNKHIDKMHFLYEQWEYLEDIR